MAGQLNIASLGAGNDKFFGDDGGYLNFVYGGAGDDKALGGDNWGTSDAPGATLPFGALLANGMQVLSGGDFGSVPLALIS